MLSKICAAQFLDTSDLRESAGIHVAILVAFVENAVAFYGSCSYKFIYSEAARRDSASKIVAVLGV
jgi:hypothetical protein